MKIKQLQYNNGWLFVIFHVKLSDWNYKGTVNKASQRLMKNKVLPMQNLESTQNYIIHARTDLHIPDTVQRISGYQ